MLKQQHQLFVAILAGSDAAIAAIACLASWAARRMLMGEPWPTDTRTIAKETLVLVSVPLTLLLMWLARVYRPRRDRSVLADVKQVAKASIAAKLVLVATVWAIAGDPAQLFGSTKQSLLAGIHTDAPRLQLALLTAFELVLLAVHRIAFRLVLREIRRRGRNLRHVAVIGTGRLGRIACRTLERNSWTGIHVAYFISHRDRARRESCMGRPVHAGLADLEETLEEHKPDAVYLAIPTAGAALVPDLLRRLERFAVDVRIIPDVQPRYLPLGMVVSELDGMPILSYRDNPHHGLGGATKRALDFLGALAAILLFSPLMFAIAAIIRATSDGPAIFTQSRVSLGGEVFDIYKFRTMIHAEDERTPVAWTSREDPRITRVGRWLRRTSLDELPQLFNVILGDMSLVGPRPERPELVASFKDNWRGYILRQHVKAGITGWAQVNGLRGDTSLRKRLQLDLFYIRHWSLGFDLKILWLTLFRGFLHRNAH